MHPVIRFVLVATPLGVILFLALSGFFTRWEGRVVSHRPLAEAEPAYLPVLIVSDDGAWQERPWPTELVRSLELPEDRSGYPPPVTPEDAATTNKQVGSLSFIVSKQGQASRVVATTSPEALTGTVIALVLLFLAHNMLLTGDPTRWWPKPAAEGEDDGEEGAAAGGSAPRVAGAPGPVVKPRPKFGPPPGRSGRGRR